MPPYDIEGYTLMLAGALYFPSQAALAFSTDRTISIRGHPRFTAGQKPTNAPFR